MNEPKVKIEELLVKEGHLTREQIEQALTNQKEQTPYKPLGAVCIDLGFLSRTDLIGILKKHKKHIYLGELFTNLGLITPDQLAEALEQQKESKKKLGLILMDMGLIKEEDLVNCLSLQLGIPRICPDINLIDRSLVNGISESYLRRNNILPAFKEDNVVTVITADPLEENIRTTLKAIFRCEIELAIAPSSKISNVIEQLFLTEVQVGKDDDEKRGHKDLVIGSQDFSQSGKDNIINILNYLITNAVAEGASDIHIEPQDNSLRVRYRIDGVMLHKTDLPSYLTKPLVSRIKVVCGLDIAERRRHQDGRIGVRVMDNEVDLRVSTYVSAYGENIVIRILNRQSHLIELHQLGFSPSNFAKFKQLLDYPSGIILVTGPTGSGKTTTLYAAINYLNGVENTIITVEDPVEYSVAGIVQGHIDPKLDLTYSDFIRSMMRQDPDVLMIGEIRDQEAAEATIQASLTGHKVLTTFHTDDTTGALLRLMDMGIDTFLISSTVVSVISQRLVRVICNKCKEPYTPGRDVMASFLNNTDDIDCFTFYQGKGCPECNYTGFKGRTAIHELLVLNDNIRDAILARKASSEIRQIARQEADLISLRDDGFYKASRGITTLEEVIRLVFHQESDEFKGRSAKEIIALCEGQELSGWEGPSLNLPAEREGEMPATSAVTQKVQPISTNTAAAEGEIYRTRFDYTTIATEQEGIRNLFRSYQGLKARLHEPLDEEVEKDFINFVIDASKNLYDRYGTESVEFSVQVQGKQPKIFIETLIPSHPKPGIFRGWRKAGKHTFNYLP